MEALADRAVACKQWRWMPGMSTTGGLRCVAAPGVLCERFKFSRPAGGPDAYNPANSHDMYRLRCLRPDLSDPATAGCLRALALGAYSATAVPGYFAADAATSIEMLEAAP
jgi:hypothetical protein